jgi:hypothetical protein
VRAIWEVMMTEPTDADIKQRAHRLWEQAGQPDGREDEFWFQAEQELREMEELRQQAEAPPPIMLPG